MEIILILVTIMPLSNEVKIIKLLRIYVISALKSDMVMQNKIWKWLKNGWYRMNNLWNIGLAVDEVENMRYHCKNYFAQRFFKNTKIWSYIEIARKKYNNSSVVH